jgi:hypothetical protein
MDVEHKASHSQEAVDVKGRFWQYAEEAMRWALQSKTETEKQALIELAHTWTQAALWSESHPPEAAALVRPPQLAALPLTDGGIRFAPAAGRGVGVPIHSHENLSH